MGFPGCGNGLKIVRYWELALEKWVVVDEDRVSYVELLQRLNYLLLLVSLLCFRYTLKR
ncbi:hypothetical protein Hanom_Chr17g01585731 [Helianthus anomalus]